MPCYIYDKSNKGYLYNDRTDLEYLPQEVKDIFLAPTIMEYISSFKIE